MSLRFDNALRLVGFGVFELLQRKGDADFGEGNFKSLFQSIERDQVRRRVVDPK